ncbi:pyruvate, water dikinase regulatory protein [Cohnella terricola]|uniref:Putative pyruvate, phosphate dikinase regulatory protein n=1 Tax=Cohnella terricola TaxID=1289167 RepID=A0A559IV86_9BACL|nr:pyruvate, water dikinase regulatory protein [Cohnella terricola]TVX91538.1 kinase/pyrophosphorylase [Cohnella terricola]
MLNEQSSTIFVCSDSVGETADAVVRATLSQFDAEKVNVKRWSHIKSEDEIRNIMEEAARIGCFVVYTLVLPELREMIRQEAIRLKVFAVDIMGPVMEAFVHTFHFAPKETPGLLHQLDTTYFKRVEAIEYTVKCDDGQAQADWQKADIMLLGVSRTSKTPLSIFLAHKGYKVANYPIVPEVNPPQAMFELGNCIFIGLTMSPESLVRIRAERLKAMGLPPTAAYASLKRVTEELEFAQAIYRKLGCIVLDVTERAIEETAGTIVERISESRFMYEINT